MNTDQHACELRVLLGPQAGSRLALSIGEYLLGTSEDCTIILAGPRVQARHLALLIADDGIRVRHAQGEVRNALGASLEDGAAVEFGAPLEMGGIWISVDGPNEPWPDAEALERLGAPQPRSEAPDPTESPSPEQAAPNTPPPPADAKPAIDMAPTPAKPAHGVLAAMAVGALAAVATIAFGLHTLWAGAEAPHESTQASSGVAVEPALRTVATVLKDLGVAEQLKVSEREDGAQLVKGYLPTGQQRNTVVKALSDLQPPPAMQVYADDELLAAANELLVAQRLAPAALLRLTSAGGGRLRLAGAARDTTLVDAASGAIMRAVPGVNRIDAADVLLPDALLAELKQRMAKAGISERVAFLSERPAVVVGGTPDDGEVSRWQQLHTGFRADYAEALPVRTAFTRPTPKLPFEIKTIVSGPAPYIVTADGEHVARGGQIGGLRLANVEDTQVVFDSKQQRLQVAR